MGGYGSGRRSNQTKIEDCHSLDVNQLRRDGWNGTSRWLRNRVEVSSISLRTSGDHLHLFYRSDRYGAVAQSITIERMPCRFGGWRPYFRFWCNKRVLQLYSAGLSFLCRHCYGLLHYSKNEGHCYRSLRQRTKHRRRLGGDVTQEAFEMPRPK